MKVFSNILDLNFHSENLNNLPKNTVATIGFFDGVHLGHRFLISQLQQLASELNTEETIITMWQHPALFFGREIRLLTTLAEKIKLFESLNVKNLVIVDFNMELAQKSTENFINEILLKQLNINSLIIGYNNTFGSDKISDISKLNLIQTIKIGKYLFNNSEKVSSSVIRNLIEENNIEKANSFLGYDFYFSGTVVTGHQNGQKYGFPTANIEINEKYKIVPNNGVYITKTKIDNSEEWLPSLLNIGVRPTFGGIKVSIENHILNFNNNLYGRNLTVKILKKIRDEIKFNSPEELFLQLSVDIDLAKHFFHTHA